MIQCSRRNRARAARLILIASLVAGTCVSASAAWARGASPYLPLNLSPEMERQIERVLILGDKPVSARPFAAAMVQDALPAACRVDEVLCRNVRRFLERYRQKLADAIVNAVRAYRAGYPAGKARRRRPSSD